MATVNKITGVLSDEISEAAYRTLGSLAQHVINKGVEQAWRNAPPNAVIDALHIGGVDIPLNVSKLLSSYVLASLLEFVGGTILQDPRRRVAYNVRVRALEDLGVGGGKLAGRKIESRMAELQEIQTQVTQKKLIEDTVKAVLKAQEERKPKAA